MGAELIGSLILGAELGGTTAFTIGSTAVTYGALTGTAVLVGASAAAAGISAALAPDPPQAEGGHLAQNRTIPPRQFGYGRFRISPYYMLYEAHGQYSVDVGAFHSGKICGVIGYFLNDDRVSVVANAVTGVLNSDGTSIPFGVGSNDGRYRLQTAIDTRLGETPETVYSSVTAQVGAGMWDSSHRGDGTASIALICLAPSSEKFTKSFPQSLPTPSVIIDALALWDFRDDAQDPDDPTTWVDYAEWNDSETFSTGDRRLYGGVVYISQGDGNTGNQPDISSEWWVSAFSNPVLQIVDYLTDADHGMGLDRASLIDPVIDALTIEANICDELVATYAAWDSGTTYSIDDERIYSGRLYRSLVDSNTNHQPDASPAYWLAEFAVSPYEPRYRNDGFFSFDNDPADVLTSILASCGGWLTLATGVLSLRVGQYSAPTVTLGLKHILGGEIRRGLAERDAVNEFQITFTDPSQAYKSQPGAPFRDETDISARGKVLTRALQLTGVQSQTQARRLAKHLMALFQSPLRGTIIATSYALAALGERYITIDWPARGLDAQPVEVQRIEVDPLAGRATIDWIAVDGDTIDIWSPETDAVSNQVGTSIQNGQRPPMLDFYFPMNSEYLGII